MNPKIAITVDAKNKAVATITGMATVGSKVEVEITGLPSGIEDWAATDKFYGKSLRFRIVDCLGNDLARFPLIEKSTTAGSTDGDQWQVVAATSSTPETYKTYNGTSTTTVNLDTDKLRHAFANVPFNETLEFGLILDSIVDAAQYAVGKIKIRQWAMCATDDPTVLPDWRVTLQELRTDLDAVEASKTAAAESATTAGNYASAAQTSASNASGSSSSAALSASSAIASKNAANEYANGKLNGEVVVEKGAKQYAEESATNVTLYPKIDTSEGGNKHWLVWNADATPAAFEDTGVLAQGVAATIAVGTTTTGAAGTNASVTNVGTSENAVFNFTIPRGNNGEGMPTGGTNGQVIVKDTTEQTGAKWKTLQASDVGAVATEAGKGLSTNDYTTAEKTKLSGVATEATKVSVSASGSATDVVKYITVNGTEKKIGGEPDTYLKSIADGTNAVTVTNKDGTTYDITAAKIGAQTTLPKNSGSDTYNITVMSAGSANVATRATNANSAISAGTASNYSTTGGIASALATKAALSHTHTKSQVTDFSHTHTKTDITDFPASMTPSAHADSHAVGGSDVLTITESQVTGLVNDLSGKLGNSGTQTIAGADYIGAVLNVSGGVMTGGTINVSGAGGSGGAINLSDSPNAGQQLAEVTIGDVAVRASLANKADKVAGATSGNFAALDDNGNLTDSGHKHADYLTAHQDISGKANVSDFALSGGSPSAQYVSTLFSSENTSNNLNNIRVSAVDSTTAATLIGNKQNTLSISTDSTTGIATITY